MTAEQQGFHARLIAAFPQFAGAQTRWIETGEDHAVAVIDGQRIFRFPRREPYVTRFPVEVALLRSLAPFSPVCVPIYDRVAPDGGFGGYGRIPGEPLTAVRFASLDSATQQQTVEAVVGMLAALRRFAAFVLAPDGRPFPTDRAWGDQSMQRWRDGREVVLRSAHSALTDRLDDFFTGYHRLYRRRTAIVHGDLTPDHVLFDDARGRLGGVIDFGDAAWGDVARDFVLFRIWGPEVLDLALDLYGAGDETERLKRACAADHGRWLAARLIDALDAGSPDAAREAAAALEPVLAAAPV